MDGAWKILTVKGQTIQHDGQFGQMIGNFVVDGQKVNYKYGNQHFGAIKVNGDEVTIGPLASTMMFVPIQPPEHLVGQGIESAKKFKIQGNNLTLLGADGAVVAELVKA